MNELVWTEDEKTLHLKSEDIQDISCECSAVYKGQTSYSIETRIKEHCCHYEWLRQLEKSAVTEHNTDNASKSHSRTSVSHPEIQEHVLAL